MKFSQQQKATNVQIVKTEEKDISSENNRKEKERDTEKKIVVAREKRE